MTIPVLNVRDLFSHKTLGADFDEKKFIAAEGIDDIYNLERKDAVDHVMWNILKALSDGSWKNAHDTIYPVVLETMCCLTLNESTTLCAHLHTLGYVRYRYEPSDFQIDYRITQEGLTFGGFA